MPGHALLVHFHYPPDGLVGAQITAKFAKYLPDAGWDAWVLTAAERYYERIDPATLADVRDPARVVRTRVVRHPRHAYVALKRALGRDDAAASRDDGAPAHAPRRRPAVIRALRDVTMTPDDVIGWIPVAVSRGARLIRESGIDCLFSSGPPFTNHLVAAALASLRRVPWVACFEDPWSDGDVRRHRARIARRLDRRLEALVVARAEAVVCLNDRHRRSMERRHRRADKFLTIPNGYDPDDFPAPSAPPAVPPFVITLTGTTHPPRTPRHVLLALRRLLDAGAIAPDDVRLRLVGACDAAEGAVVRAMIAAHGLARSVEIRPFVGRDEAMRLLAESHLLLVFAHGYVVQVPTKAYHYLHAGRPILALAPEGATADLVRASGGGVVVDPYDVPGIADAIGAYVARARGGERLTGAAPAFAARFDRRRLTRALADLLDTLVARRGTEPRVAIARGA